MRRRGGGFTLVEVIVALVVAVAAMTIVSQGFTSGAQASTSARFSTRAALLARRVITDLETGERAPGQSASGSFEDEPDFRWELRSDQAEQGLYRMELTIRWDERGHERVYTVVRLLRERTATP